MKCEAKRPLLFIRSKRARNWLPDAKPPSYQSLMVEQNPEDRFIRNLLLIASSLALLGALTLATIITVLVSANFNILNWME